MPKKTVQIANSLTNDGLNRRDFIGTTARGLGGAALGLGGLLVSGGDLFAASQEKEKDAINQTVSEHARATRLPAEAYKLPRWKPTLTGNYDLSNPLHNHFAWAKAHTSLDGEPVWLMQYGWIVFAPPGEPAYPLLGRITLIQAFLTPALNSGWTAGNEVGEHDYIAWGVFTTTHVDPRMFEPVNRVYNPYIDKYIDTPTLHYADKLLYRVGQSIVVPGVDPSFYTQPWDREGGFSQHLIDTDVDVSYTVLGSSQHDGPHQPRCDVGFWTVNRQELMDPNKLCIDTRRDYSVIQKATEYSWYGVEKGDQAQLLVHLTGLKTKDIRRLPGFIKRGILEPHGDRFII